MQLIIRTTCPRNLVHFVLMSCASYVYIFGHASQEVKSNDERYVHVVVTQIMGHTLRGSRRINPANACSMFRRNLVGSANIYTFVIYRFSYARKHLYPCLSYYRWDFISLIRKSKSNVRASFHLRLSHIYVFLLL